MATVPEKERSSLLKQLVLDFYSGYRTAVGGGILTTRDHMSPMVNILGPWLDFPNPLADRDEKEQRAKSLGIDGADYARRLTEVLESDAHLRDCLGSTVLLADYIDRSLGFPFAANIGSDGSLGRGRVQWEHFEKQTYESELRRLAYTHLFNFQSDLDCIDLGVCRIERLNNRQIARLVGGSTHAVSFLHSDSESEYFLVIEERGNIDGIGEWLEENRRKALEIITILQFFKTGVVHATYTVYDFVPNWVTDVYQASSRNSIGVPRHRPYRDQNAPYRLLKSDLGKLRRIVDLASDSRFRSRLDARKNGFRQMLFRSGAYFQSSLTREKSPERMVDLAIALESMLTPASAKTELTFRISQNLAQLLGLDASRRLQVSRSAKRLYEKRSALLHGQYDFEEYSRGEFVTDSQIDEWSNMIRLAVVRLGVLYLRGEDHREELLNKLSEISLDQAMGERIRIESDPDKFLGEFLGDEARGIGPVVLPK